MSMATPCRREERVDVSELVARFDRLTIEQPDRPAIHLPGPAATSTNRDLWQTHLGCRRLLQRAGLSPGDLIVVDAGNRSELMALLLLKYADEKNGHLMTDKKFGNKRIILVNPEIEGPEGTKIGFWDPLVEMANNFGFNKYFKVVKSVEEAKENLSKTHDSHHSAAARS